MCRKAAGLEDIDPQQLVKDGLGGESTYRADRDDDGHQAEAAVAFQVEQRRLCYEIGAPAIIPRVQVMAIEGGGDPLP